MKLSRIPCLDGLRAFSISLVLIGHLSGTRGFAIPKEWLALLPSAHFGVRIFFVISGYLITTILLREMSKHGTISLSRFYLRRTFRIFPAFYTFIAFMVLAEHFGWVALLRNDLLSAITYTVNYHHDRSWYLGHLWSLSVEEQFYLLWPAIMLVAGARYGIGVAAGYLVLAPVIRVATHVWLPESRIGIGETFQTTADAIAAGCVLAHVRGRLGTSLIYQKVQGKLPMLGILAVVYLLDQSASYISVSYTIGETLTNVGVAVCIDWCIRRPASHVGRLLEIPAVVFIGQLSYSLYLWQQPFLYRNGSSLVNAFPLNILCAIACALLSYALVEKTCLRLREIVEKRFFSSRRSKPIGS